MDDAENKGFDLRNGWASVYPVVVYTLWNRSQEKSERLVTENANFLNVTREVGWRGGHGFCNCQKVERRPTLERAACAWSSEKGRQEGERRLPYQTLARRRP